MARVGAPYLPIRPAGHKPAPVPYFKELMTAQNMLPVGILAAAASAGDDDKKKKPAGVAVSTPAVPPPDEDPTEKFKDIKTLTERVISSEVDKLPGGKEVKQVLGVIADKPKTYKGELTSVDDTLNPDVTNKISKVAGTPEDMRKSTKMPQSHQKKVYMALNSLLANKYPNYTSDITGTGKMDREAENTADALSYIASIVTDFYRGDIRNNVIIADDTGIPIAAAEIEIRQPIGSNDRAIYIPVSGSLNIKATDKMMEEIKKLASTEDIRYIVAEDLTSDLAYRAMQMRGFKPVTKGSFKGELISPAVWRGKGKREIRQKNLILDLAEEDKITQKELNTILSGEDDYNQGGLVGINHLTRRL